MSDDAWRQANALFETLLDLTPTERQARLDAECADDPELRRSVEARLAADAAADAAAFMGQPIAQVGSSTPPNLELTDATLEIPRASGEAPQRLGPYRLLHVIGQGGMGTVYAAERDDDAFERRVAIKVITAGSENVEIVRRMQMERRILAQLEHPNIARIYDAGATDDGLPYFVMEHVSGQTLDVYCAQRRVGLGERVALMRKVCNAVDYAHRNLIVHRDLKPSNILVTEDGEPKLLDFGIAKWLEPQADDETTSVLGAQGMDSSSGKASPGRPPIEPTAPWRRPLTLNYASPEQIRGEPISTASDVYSLGVIFFRLLTGILPRKLTGLSQTQIEQCLTDEEPPRPSTANASGKEKTAPSSELPQGPPAHRLQGDLDAIVLKALSSEATERYPSAAALAEDLDNYTQGFPVQARQGSWSYRTGKWLRRYRLAASLGAIIFMLAAAFIVSTVQSVRSLTQSQERLLSEKSKREQVLDLFLNIFAKASPYAAEGVDLTLREAVDQQAEQLERGLPDQPAEQAAVLSTLGWVYLDLGQSQRSHDYHLRALELRRGNGAEDIEVAESLDGVAAALRDLQDLEEAEPISAQALELYRRAPGTRPSQLLRSLNNRVDVYCYLEDWKAAAPISDEALLLSRQITSDDPETDKAMLQRAQVLRGLGDTEGARALYLEVESAYTQRYGAYYPLLAPLFNNLGRIEAEKERFESAVDYFRRADAQYVAAFGDTFYDRIIALTNLGRFLHRLGRPGEAEGALRTALDVAVRSPALGPQHEIGYFGRPANTLATIWLEQGRCNEVDGLLADKVSKWETKSSSEIVQASRSLLDQCAD